MNSPLCKTRRGESRRLHYSLFFRGRGRQASAPRPQARTGRPPMPPASTKAGPAGGSDDPLYEPQVGEFGGRVDEPKSPVTADPREDEVEIQKVKRAALSFSEIAVPGRPPPDAPVD